MTVIASWHFQQLQAHQLHQDAAGPSNLAAYMTVIASWHFMKYSVHLITHPAMYGHVCAFRHFLHPLYCHIFRIDISMPFQRYAKLLPPWCNIPVFYGLHKKLKNTLNKSGCKLGSHNFYIICTLFGTKFVKNLIKQGL